MKIEREFYFDTLDFMNSMNNLEFYKLDLSEFFVDPTEDKLKKVQERFPDTLNYNKLYLLITQPILRDMFDIKLNNEEDAKRKITR